MPSKRISVSTVIVGVLSMLIAGGTGVAVAGQEAAPTFAKDVAMHIAASNPAYVSRDEVPVARGLLDHRAHREGHRADEDRQPRLPLHQRLAAGGGDGTFQFLGIGVGRGQVRWSRRSPE